jgi:large subunit ribosomal protein L29
VKAEELRKLSLEELQEKLRESKEELFNLRFQAATGQLDNTSRIREVKKDIARIFTVLKEKEFEHESVSG